MAPADPLTWWLLGVALFAVLVWVGVRYVGWIVFGLFTYYVGRPVARWLQRRIASRSVTAGLTLTFVILPVLLFLVVFLSVALGQALELLSSEAVVALVERLPIQTENLPTDPVEIVTLLLDDPELTSVLGQFGVAVGAVTGTLFNTFLALLFAFFLLAEDRRLAGWFERTVLGPDSLTADYLRNVDRGLTSVYFGYTLTIFVVIVLAAVVYSLFNLIVPEGLRIPSPLLLAVVTGVFTLIPLVGRSIVYAFIVAVLSLQAVSVRPALLWIPVVFFVLMVLVFDNVVRTYIRPALSGKAYHIGLVMFAYLLGPVLLGWYGIFAGPLLMVLTVEFVVDVLPRLVGADPEPVRSAEAAPAGNGSMERSDSGGDDGDAPSG
ncbi:AI-2E family transporter [Halomicroarcula sp. GCM10025709]|uniref:AI-2E family transporter n=1 Tax=Halomicroarcula sp. GCM10025709 TaxID=3252669 RepID=UPI0036120B76